MVIRPHRNFATTSNHNEQSGYAPILAFCVIKHATTHVRPKEIYAFVYVLRCNCANA